MIFPKILKKEYLRRSPIWKAYLEGKQISSNCLNSNYKLFAAYFIREYMKNKLNQEEEISKIKNEDIFNNDGGKNINLAKLRAVTNMPFNLKTEYLESLKGIN